MAAPVVSGAAADLLQASPSLTPDQVKILLMQTAYKTFPESSTVTDLTGSYTSYYDIFTVGAGYLDVAAAMSSINTVPTGATAMSPTANYDPISGDVTLSFDPSSLWANQSLWGASRFGVRNRFGVLPSSVETSVSGEQSRYGVRVAIRIRNPFGVPSHSGVRNRFGERNHSGC